MILQPAQADVVALWCLATHAMEHFQHAPRLAITSAEKGSGKTTLLDVLGDLAPRRLNSGSITGAAYARVVEATSPTLIVDEADTFLAEDDVLRGVLNQGHRRGECLIRCVGDNHEARAFNVFAPVAIAALGALPDTLLSRSFVIRMQRAMAHERPARLDEKARADARRLRAMAARWVEDSVDVLSAASPDLPEWMTNREADNWRVLLAIADCAGGAWPERALRAAASMKATAPEDQSAGVKLLADIRAAFHERGVDRITSAELVAWLVAKEDRPWAEWKSGKPMTAVQLAKFLSRYEIRPRLAKFSGASARGYDLEDFVDAFNRYLPEAEGNGVTDPHFEALPKVLPDFPRESGAGNGVTDEDPLEAYYNSRIAEEVEHVG
ncbi:MAG: DUF3631 domain-containing protein [Alphaproteobacteria bacterium]|nr:DUF3631 domain-containing protein [Alphaproteobacteria bacterium]